MADPRIIDVELDERTILWRSADVEQERRIAIFDLIEGNHFAPQRAASPTAMPGPTASRCRSRKAGSASRSSARTARRSRRWSWRSAASAARSATISRSATAITRRSAQSTPQQIETVDMARRGVHNEAAELLKERLDGQDRGRFRHRAAAVHADLRAAHPWLMARLHGQGRRGRCRRRRRCSASSAGSVRDRLGTLDASTIRCRASTSRENAGRGRMGHGPRARAPTSPISSRPSGADRRDRGVRGELGGAARGRAAARRGPPLFALPARRRPGRTPSTPSCRAPPTRCPPRSTSTSATTAPPAPTARSLVGELAPLRRRWSRRIPASRCCCASPARSKRDYRISAAIDRAGLGDRPISSRPTMPRGRGGCGARATSAGSTGSKAR